MLILSKSPDRIQYAGLVAKHVVAYLTRPHIWMERHSLRMRNPFAVALDLHASDWLGVGTWLLQQDKGGCIGGDAFFIKVFHGEF